MDKTISDDLHSFAGTQLTQMRARCNAAGEAQVAGQSPGVLAERDGEVNHRI